MTRMAKSKNPDQKPPRKRARGVFVTLDPETAAALDAFLKAQPVPPTEAAVALKGLRDLLQDLGYLATKG
jgi:hypothetical protein